MGGMVCHVLNRANARLPLFECPADYGLFEQTLEQAHQRVAMRTLAYCVMPNHWHLVLWPRADGDLTVSGVRNLFRSTPQGKQVRKHGETKAPMVQQRPEKVPDPFSLQSRY